MCKLQFAKLHVLPAGKLIGREESEHVQPPGEYNNGQRVPAGTVKLSLSTRPTL